MSYNDYDQGWIESSHWSGRDDLLADMDSPAYIEARTKRIGNETQAGLTVSKAPMPQTMEEWKYLAKLYSIGIEEAKLRDSKQLIKINKLEQKLKQKIKQIRLIRHGMSK